MNKVVKFRKEAGHKVKITLFTGDAENKPTKSDKDRPRVIDAFGDTIVVDQSTATGRPTIKLCSQTRLGKEARVSYNQTRDEEGESEDAKLKTHSGGTKDRVKKLSKNRKFGSKQRQPEPPP